jgi:hypothetical protein
MPKPWGMQSRRSPADSSTSVAWTTPVYSTQRKGAPKFRKASRGCRVLMVDESVPCWAATCRLGARDGWNGPFSRHMCLRRSTPTGYTSWPPILGSNIGVEATASPSVIAQHVYSISKLRLAPTGSRLDQSACASPVMCGQGAGVGPAPLYCSRRMGGSGVGKPGERRGNLGVVFAGDGI